MLPATNNRQGLNIWLKEYSMRCWNQTDLGPNTTLAAYHLRVLEKSLNSLRLISLTIKMEIRLRHQIYVRTGGFPGGTSGKEPICQCRRVRDAGSGRSPGGGHGNPPQYSCLKNPMDRGAWRAMGLQKSWTWLKWLSTLERSPHTVPDIEQVLKE